MTSNYISYSSLDSSAAPRFNHGTVLWPELGSECCTLGGPDLFSVQCSDLGALQCSFQCSHGDSELQSRPMARAWFRVLYPRRPRLVLRPVLRPWRPPMLLPVFPRRHQAAVPARDRPRDRPMSRAWFRVLYPRRPRLVLRLVLAPSNAPSSVPTTTPSCSPSAGPTAGP
jgi:hypothetical protein